MHSTTTTVLRRWARAISVLAVCGLVNTQVCVAAPTNPTNTNEATVTAAASTETATGYTRPNADPNLPAQLSDLALLDSPVAGKHNIRIPAIAQAPNGDLLAAYDLRPTNGGANGGDSPNANWIVQRRSTDGGRSWKERTVVAQGQSGANKIGYSDPSYVVDYTTGEIFIFSVQSFDSGFVANNPAYTYLPDGTIDESNRHTLNLHLASSKDNGYTWTHRIITNDVLGAKGREVTSCFATSGAGTQKIQAPHQGRLLQQGTCRTKTGRFVAFTIFSDDHGKTWQSGNFTSSTEDAPSGEWTFDENKVVELSDGTLMLNSRSSAGPAKNYRIVATSTDGGVNWHNYRVDDQLPDSINNAQIIRPFPSAKPGTLRSKVLLFSNTTGQRSRTNGTLSLSYDDGATWPIKKEFRSGKTGYTTMAVQNDGSIGLLLEPSEWNQVGYLNFTLKYLSADLPFEPSIPDIPEIQITDRTEIDPFKISVDGNDPTLKDTFTVAGLPEGLTYDPATGTVSGSTALGNSDEQSFDVKVTFSEEDDGTGVPRQATRTVTVKVLPGAPEPATTSPSAPAPSAAAPSTPSVQPVPSAPDNTPMPSATTLTPTISATPTQSMKPGTFVKPLRLPRTGA
ncbi:exo-alpha-sialidase [Cutibacterium sp.]|uniref:sialidase family protein n=1 Tax=Cutibacterium sp. TaxID=1912221 RepID=UPI0026DDC603|nr:sialidase family protein [Cutibacterium sp.]MDO4411578.1 sialidase family protein [Cutibacterium sp.]